jgi:hypothetical protein
MCYALVLARVSARRAVRGRDAEVAFWMVAQVSIDSPGE